MSGCFVPGSVLGKPLVHRAKTTDPLGSEDWCAGATIARGQGFSCTDLDVGAASKNELGDGPRGTNSTVRTSCPVEFLVSNPKECFNV